ncbi:MAG: class I SAM-dependent methyltransferase [Thermoplasmata archaeon]|nr:class I SAM-dependent methyltransferase [Thermoplasmata archaeon]
MVATITGHRFVREVLRFVARPPLDRFARIAYVQSTDGNEALRALVPMDDATLRSWNNEYEPPAGSQEPPVAGGVPSRQRWTVEDLHARLLFVLVRRLRPGTMLETGVHHGLSTRAVLAAMARNGAGRLVSTEIDANVGDLVEPSLRDRWDLRMIAPRAAALRAVVDSLGPLDVFLHDSRHTYLWQRLEYHLAWKALRPGGYLLSDDVDSSFAFLDACREWHVRPVVLVGRSKVFGMLRKPGVRP